MISCASRICFSLSDTDAASVTDGVNQNFSSPSGCATRDVSRSAATACYALGTRSQNDAAPLVIVMRRSHAALSFSPGAALATRSNRGQQGASDQSATRTTGY